jgi:uncharacterized YccA/Bax inhibitor family protein
MGRIYMNKGRVGEERGGKETNGCPLTVVAVTAKTTAMIEMMTVAAVMAQMAAAVTAKMAAMIMAMTAAMTEMVVAVITTVEKAAADGNDREGSSRQ